MTLIQKSRGACAWAGAGSHNVNYDLELKWIILLSKGLWECFIILFAAAGLLSHCMENRYVGIRQVGIQSTLFNVLGNTLQLFFNTWLHLPTLWKHFEALFEELVPKSSDQRGKTCVNVKNTVLGVRRAEFFSYRYSPSLFLSWMQSSFSSVNHLATYGWKVLFQGLTS